ncbi:hypothetical protein CI109_104227 [Kwoniella shandongensis]|uniref:Uncharacterized protein n=1 Tax=Kwoniella shandongensis TaxID=1734106 RepID=A0AAJ8MXW4_9TREE
MSLASPIPRLDRPVCQEDASLSGSDTTAASQSDNESSDSSDEDDGVFLGPRQPSELQLLAKLSSSVLSPLPAIHRVKKRDSREFLRRKTLLLSSETQPREINQDSDDSDCSSSPRVDPTSSPSKTSEGSDLTLRLSSFHLTTPRPNRPESPLDDVGSDKENVPIKPIDNPSPSRTGSTDHPVSIGQHLTNVEDSDDGELMKPLRTLTFAEFAQLDMGGLRLCDFSDPETGLEEREGGHEVIASASLQHVEQLGESLEGTVSPRATLSPSSTDDLDSPLPVARAGPVVIPVLSSHHFTSIRAETGSPCRPLPPTLLEPPIAESTDTLVQLTAIDSPVKDLPKTSATPSCATPMPPPELVQRGAKLLKFSSVKPPTLPQPTNSTARAFAIRGQLDSALTTRKISSMGPPQRSVSSSSSTSSTSTKHTEPKRTFKKPLAKSPVGPVVPLAQSTNRIIPRPALVAKSSMPRPKINALVKPAPPTSSIPLKRPIPQPQHVRPMSMVQPITSRLPSAAPPSRPTLGQPSRILRETQMVDMQMAPVFSIGVTGETQYMTRPSFHSPGRLGLLKRSIIDKGTPKKVSRNKM